MNVRSAALAALLAASIGCGGGEPAENNATDNNGANNGKGDQVGEQTLCAAIRGNGDKIPAHFGSLARIVEHYGPIHAAAGGSSGSISSFMLSSIQASPLLSECGADSCTDRQVKERSALMLKSFQGYLEFLTTTQEAMAVQAAIPVVQRIQESGLEATLQEDPDAAAEALLGILESEELFALINPELIEVVRNSPNPAFHVQDIVDSAKNFGSFAADDPKILLRPGLISFPALADRLSMAASFYAGYGPADHEGMSAWLDNCAAAGRGVTWNEIRSMPSGDATCGEHFSALLGSYREAYDADPDVQSRGDDPVGFFMPALISTSVLTGDAVGTWREALDGYRRGEPPTELDINFDDVKFGYFGDSDSITALNSVTRERSDLKSQKAIDLGTPTWREVISISPAEPGLSRAVEIDDTRVSGGGWSDLHPVLVLRDMGCDKVVYVTRTDPESNFAIGVARMLGMTDEHQSALYDLANPDSSFSQSIHAADAVLCTNWNDIPTADFPGLIADGYNAPLQTTDPFFTTGEDAYANTTDDTGLTGCSLP